MTMIITYDDAAMFLSDDDFKCFDGDKTKASLLKYLYEEGHQCAEIHRAWGIDVRVDAVYVEHLWGLRQALALAEFIVTARDMDDTTWEHVFPNELRHLSCDDDGGDYNGPFLETFFKCIIDVVECQHYDTVRK